MPKKRDLSVDSAQTLLLGVGMVLRDAQMIAEWEADDPRFADYADLAHVADFGVPQYADLLSAVSSMGKTDPKGEPSKHE